MLTRRQFIDYWNTRTDGLGDPDSILWTVENLYNKNLDYFLCTPVISRINDNIGSVYWNWCGEYLKGTVICYSSSEELEWWGFEFEEDIILWSLRWM